MPLGRAPRVGLIPHHRRTRVARRPRPAGSCRASARTPVRRTRRRTAPCRPSVAWSGKPNVAATEWVICWSSAEKSGCSRATASSAIRWSCARSSAPVSGSCRSLTMWSSRACASTPCASFGTAGLSGGSGCSGSGCALSIGSPWCGERGEGVGGAAAGVEPAAAVSVLGSVSPPVPNTKSATTPSAISSARPTAIPAVRRGLRRYRFRECRRAAASTGTGRRPRWRRPSGARRRAGGSDPGAARWPSFRHASRSRRRRTDAAQSQSVRLRTPSCTCVSDRARAGSAARSRASSARPCRPRCRP